jgi:CRP-like cAMP-binding protein
LSYEEALSDPQEVRFLNQYFSNYQLAKIYEAGEGFGEIAIMNHEARTATMVCREDTHLMQLSRESFEILLGNYYNFLTSFEIFRSCTRGELQSLLYSV